ncbi:unnamed protein product [Angiostrongylus costaricensis]|uniref:Ovule protein n=1 Tax=Angiostrongylus costaricensis TaxID=334426 RepID=A0A0R3Q0B2_ANGCS|nr:unnamed protein product [Angiostrongylus costaricensis]
MFISLLPKFVSQITLGTFPHVHLLISDELKGNADGVERNSSGVSYEAFRANSSTPSPLEVVEKDDSL